MADRAVRSFFGALAPVAIAFICCCLIPGAALAQAFSFTDDPLTVRSTRVKAVHITELRAGINALRQRQGIAPAAFTDVVAPQSGSIRAIHIAELRTALNDVYVSLGRVNPTYTDAPQPAAGATIIKLVHVAELRAAVRAAGLLTLTASKTGTGSGTVSSSPAGITCGSDCTEPYVAGTAVTLTATPSASSVFTAWGGSCTGTAPCQLMMTAADRFVTATFTIVPVTLTATVSGSGTGVVTSAPTGINCGNDCSEVYNRGTSVTLSAHAAAGSYFANWTGACSNGGTCTLALNADTSIGAVFNTFTVDIDLTRGTVRMPNKYREGPWGVGGQPQTNFIAVPPGWSVGGQPQTNFVAVPPGWSVGGEVQTNLIAVPPGWTVGGQPQTNYVAVPPFPGWTVGGQPQTNFVTLPPGWTSGGQPQTNFVALPPGWTSGGQPQTNFLALPPNWTVAGQPQTNFVGLAPLAGWSAGGLVQTNFVSLAPGWSTAGQPQSNFVALPPGWVEGGFPQTNYVAYPGSTVATIELAYNDPGWLAWFQALKGSMSDSDLADVMIYVFLGGGPRHPQMFPRSAGWQGSAASGQWP